ncbi:DUF4331 domain-containing protein [Lysobacter sp. A3-1-A15]|uniref:DUF4331 domain-containing protein n=1 Tax=Novilysobacter viscosus TaxID=3098602 RepID=UPI002ED92C0A
MRTKRKWLCAAAVAVLAGSAAQASSHREAPLLTGSPKVDATDFYMFRSYESNRQGFVTFLANYQPLQDPYGGPNYFLMDPRAVYAIHVDSDGDALPNHSFYFRFYNKFKNLTVPVDGRDVAVPLSNIGSFGDSGAQDAVLNVDQSYVVVSRMDQGEPRVATNMSLRTPGPMFLKPFDNIGAKSIPNYGSYADRHVSRIAIDGCAFEGRVFVGQRREGFAVNLGEVFDLVNTNPVGERDAETNVLADKNVTSIALEFPISCLTRGDPVIGAWTNAYLPDASGRQRPVSRLGMPLVNELVIGLPDKDKFNASQPYFDSQFVDYVTRPTLPILLQVLFGVEAPSVYPRSDLVAAFLTGLEGLNKPTPYVRPAEMLRLNTSINPKPAGSQQDLGALAGDTAGFPNGRRPGDDVVDIELRVAMGALLNAAQAPDGQLPYTDGVRLDATQFRSSFPYLNTPLQGSPAN